MRSSDWSSDVCSSDLRQATLTLIPPPWQPSNKVRSSKPIGRPTEQSYGPRWSTARLSIFHPQLSPATDPNAFHSFNARRAACPRRACFAFRSEEHTSDLQSLMRSSYAVFCLKNTKTSSMPNHSIKQTNTPHNVPDKTSDVSLYNQ